MLLELSWSMLVGQVELFGTFKEEEQKSFVFLMILTTLMAPLVLTLLYRHLLIYTVLNMNTLLVQLVMLVNTMCPVLSAMLLPELLLS